MTPKLEDVFDKLRAAIDEACLEADLDFAAATADGALMTGGVCLSGYDLLMDYDLGDGEAELQLRMVGSTPRRFVGTPFETAPAPNALYTYEFELRLRGRKTREDYTNSYQAGAPVQTEEGDWITPPAQT
jgi:hypothetical protein